MDRFAELRRYAWTGHATLMGEVDRDWQDSSTVLAYFGRRRRQAVARYEEFVRAGLSQGSRPDLVGGGLVRSLGGWSQVLSLRRKGIQQASDARILGSGEFIEQVCADAARHEKETLRLARRVVALPSLARKITAGGSVTDGELRSGDRRRGVVRARRLFCQVAVKRMGYSGAAVARFLGVTTSSVNRLAVTEELPELSRIVKAL